MNLSKIPPMLLFLFAFCLGMAQGEGTSAGSRTGTAIDEFQSVSELPVLQNGDKHSFPRPIGELGFEAEREQLPTGKKLLTTDSPLFDAGTGSFFQSISAKLQAGQKRRIAYTHTTSIPFYILFHALRVHIPA